MKNRPDNWYTKETDQKYMDAALHCTVKKKFVFLVKCMMVKLLTYHTGICIKGPES